MAYTGNLKLTDLPNLIIVSPEDMPASVPAGGKLYVTPAIWNKMVSAVWAASDNANALSELHTKYQALLDSLDSDRTAENTDANLLNVLYRLSVIESAESIGSGATSLTEINNQLTALNTFKDTTVPGNYALKTGNYSGLTVGTAGKVTSSIGNTPLSNLLNYDAVSGLYTSVKKATNADYATAAVSATNVIGLIGSTPISELFDLPNKQVFKAINATNATNDANGTAINTNYIKGKTVYYSSTGTVVANNGTLTMLETGAAGDMYEIYSSLGYHKATIGTSQSQETNGCSVIGTSNTDLSIVIKSYRFAWAAGTTTLSFNLYRSCLLSTSGSTAVTATSYTETVATVKIFKVVLYKA